MHNKRSKHVRTGNNHSTQKRLQQVRAQNNNISPKDLEQRIGINIIDSHLITQISILNNQVGLLVIGGLEDIDFDKFRENGYSEIRVSPIQDDHTYFGNQKNPRINIEVTRQNDNSYVLSATTQGENPHNSLNLIKDVVTMLKKTDTPIPEGIISSIQDLDYDELEEKFPGKTQDSAIIHHDGNNFWCYEREGSYFRKPLEAAIVMTYPFKHPGIFQYGLTNKMIQNLFHDGDHFFRRSLAFAKEAQQVTNEEERDYANISAWSDLERTRLIHTFLYHYTYKNDAVLLKSKAINLGYMAQMAVEQLTLAQEISQSYHAIELMKNYARVMGDYTLRIKKQANILQKAVNDEQDMRINYTDFEALLPDEVQYYAFESPDHIGSIFRDIKRADFISKELEIETSLAGLEIESLPYDIQRLEYLKTNKRNLARDLNVATLDQRATDPLFLATVMSTPFDTLMLNK